ncbi:hypothetical protein MW290_05490 [Aquincola tertiaricarbonis]|uniref:IPTL-CTERM protein sorting domain-containing protein n=1 Tax=Aquincola tertiaricarbonis TaxID=391953 RepID=A0ABY4S5R6_AQUTE|nr:hypothetical protein [Aquincola tertiaricarbonis]URI08035.1 hypothetical protein MW290_05490 [Aquincola tertiaricarbonis]
MHAVPRLMTLAWCCALPGATALAAPTTVGLGVGTQCEISFGSSGANCDSRSLRTSDRGPGVRLTLQDGAIDPLSGARNSATAAATATWGALGVATGAQGNSASMPGSISPHARVSVTAEAGAAFADRLRVDAPGRAGDTGTLHVSLRLDGSLSALDASLNVGQASRDAVNASLTVDLRAYDADLMHRLATSFEEVEAAAYGNGDSVVRGGPLPRLVTMDIPVVFGREFWLQASLSAYSAVALQAPALSPTDPAYAFARSGQADTSFMHTLAWNGVGSLLDSTGQPVAQYGLWSASGTDYRVPYTAVPVPELAAAWLMLAGVIGLAGVRRLRR